MLSYYMDTHSHTFKNGIRAISIRRKDMPQHRADIDRTTSEDSVY
jgi:hypothetical protein